MQGIAKGMTELGVYSGGTFAPASCEKKILLLCRYYEGKLSIFRSAERCWPAGQAGDFESSAAKSSDFRIERRLVDSAGELREEFIQTSSNEVAYQRRAGKLYLSCLQ